MGRRVTIYDIAEALGISTATVNRALTGKPKVSEETREIVMQKAKEMGYQANSLARSLARRPLRLAVMGYTNFPEFHNAFLQGAKDVAEELRDFNIHVEYFSYSEGLSNRPEGEAILSRTLEMVADEKYDGALICAKQVDAFTRLQEAGVYVATAVNDIDSHLRQFCMRYNGRVAGKMAAELLYRWMDRSRSVAIASGGVSQRSIHLEMVSGFYEQLKDTPLKMATVYYHHDSEELAYLETHRVLSQYPDLGAIYINSFNSKEIIRALQERGKAGEILLITSDIYAQLREWIK